MRRDWAYAIRDLEGKFVRLDFDESDPSRLMSTQDVTVHISNLGQRGRRQAYGQAVLDHQDGHNQRARSLPLLEYALENVGKKPIEAILPYSKDPEIRYFAPYRKSTTIPSIVAEANSHFPLLL